MGFHLLETIGVTVSNVVIGDVANINDRSHRAQSAENGRMIFGGRQK
jgi:hypothetical protein